MLEPGAILDNKYKIEAVIGRGGFGYVYRARERLTGEAVAIKELLPSLFYDRDTAQRFIQEARATLRLTHAHIARTYGVFYDNDTFYLAMEYLPGGSLSDRLQGGPFPVPQAIVIARDLCQALVCAHDEGVVHCDIKPANVLFDARGRAHLADFGIAHVSAQAMTRRFVTATGTTMGTVRYMAPEQLEGVRDDPRVDVYAMGALLYEMLAGRPYLDFEEETTPAAQMRNMQRIQRTPPRPLRAVNPSVPERVAEVVGRALRKAPAERFSTVHMLEQALRAAATPMADRRPVQSAAAPTEALAQREGEPQASRPASLALPKDHRPHARAAPIRPVAAWPTTGVRFIHHLWSRLIETWRLVPRWTRGLFVVALLMLAVFGAAVVATLAGIGQPSAGGTPTYFVSDRSGRPEIYRLTSEADVERVTHTPGGESWDPALGPAGVLYFSSNRDGKREIYRLTSEASVERVTRTPGGESWAPALGPAGMLYFTSNRDGRREIYRLASEAGVERVTHTPGSESWDPALGPAGMLYFASSRDGRREIYRLASEAGVERVTHTPGGESWAPALGPGGMLYFTSNRDGRREIYRLASEAGVERVTHTPSGESWAPALGPAGMLIFTSDRAGKPEVYRLDPSAGAVRVTDTRGKAASWVSSLE
jgi:Tol biopolymer transport system component